MRQQLDAADAERITARARAAVAAAERAGSHLWTVMVAYRVTDPTADGAILDRENLLTYPMVGCFVCEQPYTARLAHRRCTGEPAQ